MINFFLSTDIKIGLGALETAAESIYDLGKKVPVIIYDSNLKANNYFLNNLKKIIKKFPNNIILQNESNSEPTYGDLEKLNNEVKKHTPDLIIAIGGGSTMDLGKGIALLLNNNVSALSLKGFPKNVNDPLPLVTIPSIFGSGSEVSFNAVFIDENENRKLGINTRKNFPALSIIDPHLTMTAPQSAVISSSLDTLVHCIDSFGSNKSSVFSRLYSVEGFNRTFNTLLNEDLNNPESRINLAIGSICGIFALMNSGDGPTNGFAYYFGVKNKIAHGLAGGIFLKDVMFWNYNNGYEDYSKLISKNKKITNEDSNNNLFESLNILYEKFNIPNLTSYGYKANDIEELSINVSNALGGSFEGNPIPFDKKSAKEVLNKLL